jgi:hypothetical protein
MYQVKIRTLPKSEGCGTRKGVDGQVTRLQRAGGTRRGERDFFPLRFLISASRRLPLSNVANAFSSASCTFGRKYRRHAICIATSLSTSASNSSSSRLRCRATDGPRAASVNPRASPSAAQGQRHSRRPQSHRSTFTSTTSTLRATFSLAGGPPSVGSVLTHRENGIIPLRELARFLTDPPLRAVQRVRGAQTIHDLTSKVGVRCGTKFRCIKSKSAPLTK